MTEQRPFILVPVDFSETSHKALDLARELSPRLGLEIVLLHVFEPPMMVYPDASPGLIASIYQESFPAAQRALEALSKSLGGLPTLFREGNPGHEIVSVAKETAPALIALGTHGRRGIERIVLGSVAEHVLRHAGVPVLTVRSDAE
jgi:nucleotide-binding universal stress UspA family protein